MKHLRLLVGCLSPLGRAADATEVNEELFYQAINERDAHATTAIAAQSTLVDRTLYSPSSMDGKEVVYPLTSALED